MTNEQRLRRMETLPDDAMVGIRDASVMLGQHPQSVRRLYHDGLLRARQNRPRGSIWFRMGDLRRFVHGG